MHKDFPNDLDCFAKSLICIYMHICIILYDVKKAVYICLDIDGIRPYPLR